MHNSIHPTRPIHSRRARLLVAALVSGFLVAGCGGSSHSPTSAAEDGASTPAPSSTSAGSASTAGSSTAGSNTPTGTAASPGPGAPAAGGPGLAFAVCMRANGVPNFPDPVPGGAFLFRAGAGLNPSSPAVKAARVKCAKLLPGGGPPGPGSTTHPSAQTLAKLLKIARCMRQHGISQFPDPRTSVPVNLAGITDITDFDGVILLYPATFNLQAPAYKRALAACGAPPLGLRH
jgi:hypothetical protein